MITRPMMLLLADDDSDDRMFFKEALEELQISTNLTLVKDGDELMALLKNETTILPHAIFLDINMPRKNGIECLEEIKVSKRLKEIPVIMFTTAYEENLVNSLYNNGVKYYIRKPHNFSELKNVIERAIWLIDQGLESQTKEEDFVITAKQKSS